MLDINKITGEVFINKELDYEVEKEIRTIVELRNSKSKTVYDFAQLVIKVKDLNDNEPKISFEVIPPATIQVFMIKVKIEGKIQNSDNRRSVKLPQSNLLTLIGQKIIV